MIFVIIVGLTILYVSRRDWIEDGLARFAQIFRLFWHDESKVKYYSYFQVKYRIAGDLKLFKTSHELIYIFLDIRD